MHTKVSVIIPTFNRASFVVQAIDSVLAQEGVELEVLVVDDGSTDETSCVLQRYQADARIKLFRQENQGQSVARNKGFHESTGDFICFLDSDNRWRPGKLARQLSLMHEHPEMGVVYGDNVQIDEAGSASGIIKMKRHSGWVTHRLLEDNFVTFNTAMVRRHCLESVDGLDESVRVADDYDLWLRVSCVCQFLYVPEVWGEYRVMSDQISSDKEKRFASNQDILTRFLDSRPGLATKEVRSATWTSFYVRRARWRASVGRKAEALGDLRRALRYRFFDRRAWRAILRTLVLPA